MLVSKCNMSDTLLTWLVKSELVSFDSQSTLDFLHCTMIRRTFNKLLLVNELCWQCCMLAFTLFLLSGIVVAINHFEIGWKSLN